MYTLSTDNILSKVGGKALFNHYLRSFHDKSFLEPGTNIQNPILERKQKTPSFNYYQSTSGKWFYKDFVTGDSGDIFNLIMRLNKCSFMDSLKIINSDFSLGLEQYN